MLQLSVSGNSRGQQLNASFAQGDVVAWAFTGAINGTPINLTDALIKMTIDMGYSYPLNTINGGITITNALAGQFSVNISSDDTAGFLAGIYPYDLWIEPQVSPPVETQYITGMISVYQSITDVP